MKRREFISLLVGAAAAARPVTTRAQGQRTRPLLGWLGGSSPAIGKRNLDVFLQRLKEHVY
jgi:hypothetical protein